MREFLGHRNQILQIMTERDAPPPTRNCSRCGSTSDTRPMRWRCHTCYGEPVFCSECIRESHQTNPFHVVSRWDGTAFHRSTLSKAGLTLNLGHCGLLCQAYGYSSGIRTSQGTSGVHPDSEHRPVNLSGMWSLITYVISLYIVQ